MECLATKKLPLGDEWSYELKLDGYRAQALRDAESLRILSKNGKDLTARFPATAAALKVALPIGTVIDGGLVAFDEQGHTSFNKFQNAYGSAHVVFFGFDLLMLAFQSLAHEPLTKRRQLLAGICKPSELADISCAFPADNPEASCAACVKCTVKAS